jgi:hypothetical protein
VHDKHEKKRQRDVDWELMEEFFHFFLFLKFQPEHVMDLLRKKANNIFFKVLQVE